MSAQHDAEGAVHARLAVLVEAPQHSGLLGPLDYLAEQAWPAGTLVRVPLGRRVVTGVVWGPGEEGEGSLPRDQLKPITEALPDLPPLPATWRQLVRFAAGYYQRALGEMAMMVLPPELRQIDAVQWGRRFKRLNKVLNPPPPKPLSKRKDRKSVV